MKKPLVLGIVLLFSSLLVACATSGSAQAPAVPTRSAPTEVGQLPSASPTSQEAASQDEGLQRTDSQGSVTVEVTPLNLDEPGETLDFEVAMNTHSVNLGMDLAELVTLETDNHAPVQAVKWEGPSGGGHHVSGKLTFPASVDGKPFLQGATRVTLTINKIDAPSRLFTWQLSK